jgi:chromosome segregation ATPase
MNKALEERMERKETA